MMDIDNSASDELNEAHDKELYALFLKFNRDYTDLKTAQQRADDEYNRRLMQLSEDYHIAVARLKRGDDIR